MQLMKILVRPEKDEVSRTRFVQPDWTSCAGVQKMNLPQDQEGYDGFEDTNEKLSTWRIHWYRVKFYIFFFGELFFKNIDENLPIFLLRTVECASPKALIQRSQVLLKFLSLVEN